MFAMVNDCSDFGCDFSAAAANKVRNRKAKVRIEEGGRFIRWNVFMKNAKNGANGMSETEGKAAMVAATERGKRRSFNEK